LAAASAWAAPNLSIDDIVSRSVAAAQANWKAAPEFGFREHDVITKGGTRRVRTYQVWMLEGSTYNKLIAEDCRPLSASEASREEEKLQQEVQVRRSESVAARKKRIGQYDSERRQDHELMLEMVHAFQFRLAGTERVNGRECFRVEATPKPGYVPKNRETKVLTGMRGTLWIDSGQYQWVKVTASVFRPVSFGLFIARVEPGTEFTLEQAPVEGSIWLPTHFEVRVNSRVVFWSHNSIDDETYSQYRRTGANPATPPPGPPAWHAVQAQAPRPSRLQ